MAKKIQDRAAAIQPVLGMSGRGINSPNFLGFSVGRDIGPGWPRKNFQQDALLSGTITKKKKGPQCLCVQMWTILKLPFTLEKYVCHPLPYN